jgi:hypothetical protein
MVQLVVSTFEDLRVRVKYLHTVHVPVICSNIIQVTVMRLASLRNLENFGHPVLKLPGVVTKNLENTAWQCF